MKPFRFSEEIRNYIVDQKRKNVPSKTIKEDILQKFGRSITYNTIRETWTRYQRTNSIDYYKPLGRPKSLNEREERAIIRDFIAHPGKSIRSTIQLQKQQPIANKPVSRRTLSRVLRRRNLTPRISRKGSEIKIKNRNKRLTFAYQYSKWTIED